MGGSAAQSTLFPVFDAVLGVSHSSSLDRSSKEFLSRSRDMMPVPHAKFISYCQDRPSIREVLLSAKAYFACEGADEYSSAVASHSATTRSLAAFRSMHVKIVNEYILQPQLRLARRLRPDFSSDAESDESAASAVASISAEKSKAAASGGKGTGGSPILDFLRPMHCDTVQAVIEDA